MPRRRLQVGDPVGHLDHPDLKALSADSLKAFGHLRRLGQAFVQTERKYAIRHGLAEIVLKLGIANLRIFQGIVKQGTLQSQVGIADVFNSRGGQHLHGDETQVHDVRERRARHFLPAMSVSRKAVGTNVEVLGPRGRHGGLVWAIRDGRRTRAGECNTGPIRRGRSAVLRIGCAPAGFQYAEVELGHQGEESAVGSGTIVILMRAFGVLLIGLSVYRAISGQFKSENNVGQTETLDRSRNPVRFWAQLAIMVVIGLVLILAPIQV